MKNGRKNVFLERFVFADFLWVGLGWIETFDGFTTINSIICFPNQLPTATEDRTGWSETWVSDASFISTWFVP